MTDIQFDWNDEKNAKLIAERNISFEEIVHFIENGNVLSIIDHPNQEKYPGQRIFIIQIRDYVCMVPFVQEKNTVFLKTIIPSRKATRDFKGGEI